MADGQVELTQTPEPRSDRARGATRRAHCQNRDMTMRRGDGGRPRRDRSRTPVTARRRRAVVGALASLALLAGCTGSSGLTSEQARAAYDPVLQDVAKAAAGPLGAKWKDGTGGGTNLTTEGCRWFTKTMTAELDPTETPDWDAVIAGTKAALAAHGFPPAQQSQLTGGFTGIEAHDDKGARVTIQSKGTTNIRVSVPVNGPC